MNSAHSAHVQAWLLLQDEQIAVGSVGPTYFVLRTPQQIPAGTAATLQVVVNHEPTSWQIILLDGAGDDTTVAYVRND